MSRRNRAAAGVAALSLLALAASLAAADYIIDWWTVDGGGDMWLTEPAARYELSGTIAQPDASSVVMTGGGFEVSGGFWPGALGVGPPVPGDCDGDHRVDFDDFGIFGACMTGPGSGIIPECSCADLDGDGDSDLTDFALFQRAFTGP